MKTMYVVMKPGFTPEPIAVCDKKEDAIKAFEIIVGNECTESAEAIYIKEVIYIGVENANQD